MMASDRLPAVGNAVPALSFQHRLRIVKTVVHADEGFALRIKTINGFIHGINSVVIAAFTIFRLVVNCRPHHFDLTGREIALEIGLIIRGIPQTEFYEAEQVQMLFLRPVIGQDHAVDLAGVADRNKGLQLCCYLVLAASDNRIAQAVTAGPGIKLRLCRLPAGIPDGVSVLYVIVASSVVQRAVVVAVSGDAKKLCIFIKGISACCV